MEGVIRKVCEEIMFNAPDISQDVMICFAHLAIYELAYFGHLKSRDGGTFLTDEIVFPLTVEPKSSEDWIDGFRPIYTSVKDVIDLYSGFSIEDLQRVTFQQENLTLKEKHENAVALYFKLTE